MMHQIWDGFGADDQTGGGDQIRRRSQRRAMSAAFRARRVRLLRAAVRAGRYESEFKLSIAADKLISWLGKR